MKTYNCREIYFGSTEKSLTSGSPGFGVRTHTRDMSADTAERLGAAFATGYGVDYDRQLSIEDLERNPSVVYDFAPELDYRKITLPDGNTYYVAMRTVYIAVDYGFFTPGNGAMRAGSNYFSHLFVFDTDPGAAVFSAIKNEKLWIPRDYTCRPDNAEMQALLTGDPVALPPATLGVDALPLETVVNTRGMDVLLPALLQARDNRKAGKDRMLTQIIVLQREADTLAMIDALGAVPRELMEEMYFVTNYDKGYSVPDDLGMVFVNEHNRLELFTDNHITVDLVGGTTKNIDTENVIYNRVAELVRNGDVDTLRLVLNWYLSLDPAQLSDPAFAYEVLMATDTPHPLEIDKVNADFILRSVDVSLTDSKRHTLNKKINTMLSTTIEQTTSSSELVKALDLAVTFHRVKPRELDLSEGARGKLSRILFVKGADAYLGKLVHAGNVGLLCAMLTPEQMGTPDQFFAALGQSADLEVWNALLHHYFRGIYSADLTRILNEVLASKLSRADKNSMVLTLFPLTSKASYLSELVDWYRANPAAIREINEPVHSICMNTREECFSRLVDKSTPRDVVTSLGVYVAEYFEPRIMENPNSAMEQVSLMIKRMSPEVFEQLDAMRLFELYLDEAYRTPSDSAVKVMDNIRKFGVRLPDRILDRMNSLQCLLTGKEPAEVNTEVMSLALKLPQLKVQYIARLSAKWIDSAPSPDEVKRFMKDNRIADSDIVSGLIYAVWNSESRTVHADRKVYIEAVTDNARWSGDQKKAFISSCKDAELAAMLKKADSFLGKMFRKFF